MGEWSANNQERARALWDRLLGCFGDPLLKKFGAEPPEEWVLALGSLDSRQIARGMRRIVFGWKGPPPSLPDFMRLCRSVGEDDFDEGPRPLERLNRDDGHEDPWLMTANRHLLAHLLRVVGENPKCYGHPDEPGFVDNVQALVTAKNLWVADMRDLATHHP